MGTRLFGTKKTFTIQQGIKIQMNSQTILFNQESKIYLNTAVTPLSFSKARQGKRISETGVLATKTESGWNFEPWSFTGTISSNEILQNQAETVFLSGDFAPFTTLKDQFSARSKDNSAFQKAKTVQTAALVVSSMQEALKTGTKLPVNGAGGILISNDKTKILYLPQDLFNTSVSCFGETIYSQEKGFFVNENLQYNQARLYEQALICYVTLSETLPFLQENTKLRNEDQKDNNFIPLKNKVWALNHELSSFIDKTLKIRPDTTKDNFQKMSESSLLPLKIFYKEAGLTEDGLLPPDETLLPVIRKSNISQEQFSEKAEKRQESFQKKLSIKRHFRHNSTKYGIIATGIAVTLSALVIHSNNLNRQPTTMGLTSTETIESFFSAINTLNVTQASSCVKGKTPEKIVDVLSNYYVAAQSRSAYEAAVATKSPAEWLNFNNDGHFQMFGITQFYIDGAKSSIFYQAKSKKECDPAILEENGEILQDGTTITHKVQYFLVTDMTEEYIEIQNHNDVVTLTYKNNKWLITNLQQSAEPLTADVNELYQAYLDCYEKTSGNTLEYSKILSEKFSWIPTTSEILEAYNYMENNW